MTPVRPETMVHRHGTLPARVSREERWVWTGIGGFGMTVSDCGEFENHTIFEYTDQFMTRIRA
jgi:hypothetical protein